MAFAADPKANNPAPDANNSGKLNDDSADYGKKLGLEERLEKLEREHARTREELAMVYELLAARARG